MEQAALSAEWLEGQKIWKTPSIFDDFSVLRLEFILRAEESLVLPDFLGSTLHGAFGHALKNSACQLEGVPCQSCRIPPHCWYGWLFETVMPSQPVGQSRGQDAPRPFVLTPPLSENIGGRRRLQRGDRITFSLSLFGNGLSGLPFVVYAIDEMARRGLGENRGVFSLRELYFIDRQGERISLDYNWVTRQYNPLKIDVLSVGDLVRDRLQKMPDSERLILRFQTRARIRIEKQLQRQLDFTTLIRFLWNRITLMLNVHGSGITGVDRHLILKRADQVRTTAADTFEHKVSRISNRQMRLIPYDGVLGEFQFEGPEVRDFRAMLAAGELLHLGSGASFGLGKYVIVESR